MRNGNRREFLKTSAAAASASLAAAKAVAQDSTTANVRQIRAETRQVLSQAPQSALSHIRDVWGHFGLDLNFRCKPPYGPNQAEDYPGLTAENLVAWHKAIHADRLAWCYIKFQSGHAAFPSKVLPPMKNLPSDFFRRCCELSKAEGMYVVGYTCGGDDVYAFGQHPEWFREYGRAYACLNAAPFWDREFAAIQEALRLFPCDGLFYDMVRFSGKCRCECCQAAYKRFYGEAMPAKHHVARFRLDTFRNWAERATRAPRQVVPGIEICVNHQWLRPDGLPFELLEFFDWYYTEFGAAEWVGEILRAWGDKPILSGNAIEPRFVTHLLGRRMSPLAYDHDIAIDYRTGKLPALDDVRIRRMADTLGEARKREPFLKGAVAIQHATVLFTSAGDLSKTPDGEALKTSLFLLPEEKYADAVGTWVRDAARMNLSCCNVEVVERLASDKLARYEVVFVPELARAGGQTLGLLLEWVRRGGILLASGPFALAGDHGNVRPDFADDGLLGVKKVQGPLAESGLLTALQTHGTLERAAGGVSLEHPILCESKGAEPVAYGNVGVAKNVPLMWRNRIAKGIVFYLAGRMELGAGRCVETILSPNVRRAPFKTSLRDPAEVWLNQQPGQKRLVLHIVAYGARPSGQQVAIRADLLSGEGMEIVYPEAKRAVIRGKRQSGYVTFTLSDVAGHVISVMETA